MRREALHIHHIPALLWGERTGRVIIAVHGNLSHKADVVIELLAQTAAARGYQVLSFDLPEHGERRGEPTLCKAENCVEELGMVLAHAGTLAEEISLFGCSIGAYFGLLAYRDVPLRQALFLSPILDMEHLIQKMMTWFSVSEEQLEGEREVATPMGQTLYWDYYCYVRAHPVTRWETPTAILYGAEDALCERGDVSAFTGRFGCGLTVLEGGEHFFHTPEQLDACRAWLEKSLGEERQAKRLTE